MLNPVKYKVGSVVNPIKSCVGQGRCGNVWGGGLGESERLIFNVTLIYEHNPLCGLLGASEHLKRYKTLLPGLETLTLTNTVFVVL